MGSASGSFAFESAAGGDASRENAGNSVVHKKLTPGIISADYLLKSGHPVNRLD